MSDHADLCRKAAIEITDGMWPYGITRDSIASIILRIVAEPLAEQIAGLEWHEQESLKALWRVGIKTAGGGVYIACCDAESKIVELQAKLAACESQRVELLAACKAAMPYVGKLEMNPRLKAERENEARIAICKQLRAAIANAEPSPATVKEGLSK